MTTADDEAESSQGLMASGAAARRRPRLSPWMVPALIVLSAAAVRFVWIAKYSLWYDELYTVWATHLPVRSVIKEAIASGHPPLYYLMGYVWFALGSGEIWVRLISCVSGVATVAVVYLTGRELFSRRAGIWAAALTAYSPVLVWYSREATSYSWMVFLSTLTLYMLVRSARRGGWLNWSGYLLAAGAGCLTYFLFPVLLVAGWAVFWLIREQRKGNLAWWVSSQVVLAAAAVVLALESRTDLASGWLTLQWPDPRNLFYGLLEIPIVIFAGAWILNDLSYKGLALGLTFKEIMALVVGIIIAGIVSIGFFSSSRKAFAGRRTAAVAIFTSVLLAVPVIIDTVMNRAPAARFYLWGVPPFLLLAAGGIVSAPRKVAAVAGALVVATSFCLTVVELEFNDNKVGDWRSLMATVSGAEQPRDLLYCFSIHMCSVASSFYLSQPLPLAGGMPSMDTGQVYFMSPGVQWNGYRSGFFTGHGLQPFTGAELEARINADVNGYDRVWLVDSDDTYGSIPSTPELIRILETNWKKVREWDFPPDELKLYVRK